MWAILNFNPLSVFPYQHEMFQHSFVNCCQDSLGSTCCCFKFGVFRETKWELAKGLAIASIWTTPDSIWLQVGPHVSLSKRPAFTVHQVHLVFGSSRSTSSWINMPLAGTEEEHDLLNGPVGETPERWHPRWTQPVLIEVPCILSCPWKPSLSRSSHYLPPPSPMYLHGPNVMPPQPLPAFIRGLKCQLKVV